MGRTGEQEAGMVLTSGCSTIVWSQSRTGASPESPDWPLSTWKRKEAGSPLSSAFLHRGETSAVLWLTQCGEPGPLPGVDGGACQLAGRLGRRGPSRTPPWLAFRRPAASTPGRLHLLRHLRAWAEGAHGGTGFLPPTGSGLPQQEGPAHSPLASRARQEPVRGLRCSEVFQAGDAGVRQGWGEQVCQGGMWFLGLPSSPSGHVTDRAAEPMVPEVTGPGHSTFPPGKAPVTTRLRSQRVLWGRPSPHLCSTVLHAHTAVASLVCPGLLSAVPPEGT